MVQVRRSIRARRQSRNEESNSMNMKNVQDELENILNGISKASNKSTGAKYVHQQQEQHSKSGDDDDKIASTMNTRSTRSSRSLRNIIITSEINGATVKKSSVDETVITAPSSQDISPTSNAEDDGSSQKDAKNRKSNSCFFASSDDESMNEPETENSVEVDSIAQGITDDSSPFVASNDNDNSAQDSSFSAGAPRRSTRRRFATARYSLQSQEGSGEEEYAMEEIEDSESEVEISFDDEVEEEQEFDADDEHEWNLKNDPWAKESALYDSSLEESDYEEDDYSDDDLFEGHQRIRNKGRHRKRRTRRNCPKPRAIRRNIDVIPVLSIKDKQVHLAQIDEEEEDKKLLYKFLQCVMWDFNFRYNLLSHQYKGVLVVAGVNIKALCERVDMFDQEKQDMLVNLEDEGVAFRREICSVIAFVETKGILLADDMGLGKTVQGLGAAILRNSIYAIQSESNKKIRKNMPTIIISPNRDVLDQWEESLLVSGIHRTKIKLFWALDQKLRQGDTFVLLTRHELMSEIRNLMLTKKSNLFPAINTMVLNMLENQYMAGQSKARNEYRLEQENESQAVTRILRSNADRLRVCFRTILIDEAHFLKNLVSYWGIATALLGLVSQRSVPLSGTPYNNGPQDMATLMAFIDPGHASADVTWWEMATEGGHRSNIAQYVAAWKENYMIRRDKSVLAIKLPPKTVESRSVSPFPTELNVYVHFEQSFLKSLKDFANLSNRANLTPEQRNRQKDLFKVLMATMSQMRMALIHPLLPGGRELTIKFSPTRRNMIGHCSKDIKSKCVCCKRFPTQPAPDKTSKSISEQEIESALEDGGGTGEDEQLQDESFDNNGQQRNNSKKKKQREGEEKLVPLDFNICYAAKECQHYAHESCLEELVKNCKDELKCPRCKDLELRMKIAENTDDVPHETYCEHIEFGPHSRGIKATAKLQDIVKWAKGIPKGDKAIAYSFFKGGLDLIEGIFVEHLGIECARFDGDVAHEDRAKELANFKTSKTCRILLASVQSSGVGLNIVEANHVAFLDRWFNPCVHAQAEDRCHRLKQTKEVHVKYFDMNCTVDQVMATINNMKKNNASILLADGSQIGAQQNSVKYRDLSGSIGEMMKAVEIRRRAFDSLSPGQSYGSIGEEELILASQKDQKNSRRKTTERQETKLEQSLETEDRCDILERPRVELEDDTTKLSSFNYDSTIKHEVTTSDKPNDEVTGPVFFTQNSSLERPSIIDLSSSEENDDEGLPGPAFGAHKNYIIELSSSEEDDDEGLPGPAFGAHKKAKYRIK